MVIKKNVVVSRNKCIKSNSDNNINMHVVENRNRECGLKVRSNNLFIIKCHLWKTKLSSVFGSHWMLVCNWDRVQNEGSTLGLVSKGYRLLLFIAIAMVLISIHSHAMHKKKNVRKLFLMSLSQHGSAFQY